MFNKKKRYLINFGTETSRTLWRRSQTFEVAIEVITEKFESKGTQSSQTAMFIVVPIVITQTLPVFSQVKDAFEIFLTWPMLILSHFTAPFPSLDALIGPMYEQGQIDRSHKCVNNYSHV